MQTIKPATPLPWGPRVKIEGNADLQARMQDWKYRDHAANAYPKLVAALREWLPEDPTEYGTQDAAMASLLRELGEDDA